VGRFHHNTVVTLLIMAGANPNLQDKVSNFGVGFSSATVLLMCFNNLLYKEWTDGAALC
jgi:hypothetical protein